MSDLQHSPNPPGRDMILSAPLGAPGMVYLEPLDTAASRDDSHTLLEYWYLIRGRKLLIGAFALLGGLLAVGLSYLQTPLYQARTTLEIQSIRNTDAASALRDAGSGGFTAEAYLQTQVKVLQSKSLRNRVLEKLKKQEWTALAPVNRLAAWRKKLGLPVSAVEANTARQQLPQAAVLVQIADNSRIIEVVCDSPDPRYSAAFANAMADEYVESNLEAAWDSAERTTDWLTRQLEDMRSKLHRSENQLQTYSRDSDLVFTGDRESVEEKKLEQLQQELSVAEADRIAKQSSYEIASSSTAESVPQVIDNGRLSDYRSKLAELRRELAEYLSLFTPSHYKVMRVQAQIAELESTLKHERSDILNRILNEYQAAQRRENLLKNAYAKQLQVVSEKAKRSIYYGILQREVETNRQLYEELLQKVKQVSVGSALQHASNVRILDSAEPPTAPYKPNPIRMALMGIASGLVAGVGLVIVGDFVNRSLKAPGEAAFHLKVPELGVIPSYKSGPRVFTDPSRRLLPLRGAAADVPGRQPDRVALATWQDRPSILAESFRSALASILVSRSKAGRPRVILITSAGRGEGKSSTVSNLGIALAEINQKILLLDADMRKPHLHHVFNLANSWGLSDLLREKHPLKECPIEALARPTEIEGLYVLPSGPGTVSIANLLYSSRMSELLDRVRDEFDTVIIDTPPMSYLSDARVLGRLADGAILVIRAGQTTRDMALAAKQRLVDDGIPVLGTILNGWDSKSKARYGYSPYTYNYTSNDS